MVQQVADKDSVLGTSVEMARSLARLGVNRENFAWMKEHIYGENAAIHGAHGPAHMLRNPSKYAHGPRRAAARR